MKTSKSSPKPTPKVASYLAALKGAKPPSKSSKPDHVTAPVGSEDEEEAFLNPTADTDIKPTVTGPTTDSSESPAKKTPKTTSEANEQTPLAVTPDKNKTRKTEGAVLFGESDDDDDEVGPRKKKARKTAKPAANKEKTGNSNDLEPAASENPFNEEKPEIQTEGPKKPTARPNKKGHYEDPKAKHFASATPSLSDSSEESDGDEEAEEKPAPKKNKEDSEGSLASAPPSLADHAIDLSTAWSRRLANASPKKRGSGTKPTKGCAKVTTCTPCLLYTSDAADE